MHADECYERCVELALPQRQAQLARKASRGEIALGQPEPDVILTEEDVRETFREWFKTFLAESVQLCR